ncbi:peptidylprolyl isomerase [Candidatus Kaiserbacteria bacterium]|nr:MAG: peptidylprolyl isomerase [Candidatus Kaiserbacteria bacterium]
MSPEETNEPVQTNQETNVQSAGQAPAETIPLGDEVTVVMETSMGSMTLELNAKDAPNTVANFVKLAQDGFYDGTKFHRVIANFMIQGGDPLTKDDAQAARWGTGGPGYTFADEIHANNNNAIGTISMANAGPDTNGSQFFINVANNDFLDDKHTVFGIVTEGMDVVNAIVGTPTQGQDRPIEAVVINSVSVR